MNEDHRERRRAQLEEFYGKTSSENDAYDIDSPRFEAETFARRLVKEGSLRALLSKEDEILNQIRTLDSDMQTLVYENYNKFISATDTIHQMRSDFGRMEGEMEFLAEKMIQIAEFSASVSGSLESSRSEIVRLSGTHSTLKRLQFLFELPKKLKESSECGDVENGVRLYLRASGILQNTTSFAGIKKDCDLIMEDIKEKLRDKLKDPSCGTENLNTSVDLLLQLGEPAQELCDLYLKTGTDKLKASLRALEKREVERSMDVLEFIDKGCNTFVSDLCLVVASYVNTFVKVDETMSTEKLVTFLNELMEDYLNLIRRRLKEETNLSETAILVRGLDRFHRRLQAMCRLVTAVDFNKSGLDLILDAALDHCKLTFQSFKSQLGDCLLKVRHQLAASNSLKRPSDSGLSEINTTFLSTVSGIIREGLTNLTLFIDPELNFAVKTYFRSKFCRHFVREGVLVAFLKEIVDVCRNFCVEQDRAVPSKLILLLSRSCFDMQSSTTQYMLNLVDDQFFIDDCKGLTPLNRINEDFRRVSNELLVYYVRLEGQVLSQMIRKSVETRDWLNTVEPRTVRAVMKRVVEETTSIDRLVGQLYEEGTRKARSSDSSRRTRFSASRSKAWNNSSGLDNSLASNIQKMFSEKIQIFSPVEFSRVSILTGIIKIALKTLLECVRLRTFSRFGFQQLQVDCHYLHLYLWRFVSDENLITFMLDEIMTSGVHRCLDASPMEHSVVEIICDKS